MASNSVTPASGPTNSITRLKPIIHAAMLSRRGFGVGAGLASYSIKAYATASPRSADLLTPTAPGT
ncbi:hypothetical protein, partial [Sphingomonas sp. DC1200-1]|uniref:hypothetical protein n=1 Tax=Sphingomonas sp. DC1200-1 TaxID=2804660 RepID=UPI003CEF35C7